MNNQYQNPHYRLTSQDQRILMPQYPVYPHQVPITAQNVQQRIMQNIQGVQNIQNSPIVNSMQQHVQNIPVPVQNVNINYRRTDV
jgi:hypothetical protein